MKISIFLFITLPYGISCLSFGLGILGLSSLYAGYKYAQCIFGGCCKSTWSDSEFIDLEKDLNKQLHGQHIAQEILLRHLKSHYLDDNPKKALVLSLHGTTGSGKNFVTSIAVKNLLQRGEQNRAYKLWTAKHHFSDANKLERYKQEVKKTIQDMVKSCPRSIFVFDETNELPEGLLDILKPMMDVFTSLEGVDYRKTTFFFLSNTGSTQINEIIDKSKKGYKKKHRSKLTLNDFQNLIQEGAFNEEGGLKNAKLIEKNLIDSYVPFLPMEREHIKLCIRDYLASKACPIDDNFIDKIANLVNFEPPGADGFASFGCRGVDSLVKQELDHDCIFSKRVEL